MIRGRKFKRSGIDLDDVAKGRMAVFAVTFGVHDLALVKGDICQMKVRFYKQKARHLCAFDHLNGVKNADKREVSGKGHIGSNILW